MAEFLICFRLRDGGVDDRGNLCPCGMRISLGETQKSFDYAEITKDLNVRAFLDAFGLVSIDADRLTIITPEEYEREYGDGAK